MSESRRDSIRQRRHKKSTKMGRPIDRSNIRDLKKASKNFVEDSQTGVRTFWNCLHRQTQLRSKSGDQEMQVWMIGEGQTTILERVH